MSSSKVEALRGMVERAPNDSLARYMLANELYKEGRYQEAVDHIEQYLRIKEDEGAAYRLLGDALIRLGKEKEARWAFRQGAEAALAHHHEGMAEEFEERLKELE